MYAKVYRSDFYSKELLGSLRPDNYKDIKYAYYYLKNKLYDDLTDVIDNTHDITLFEQKGKLNTLENLVAMSTAKGEG
jgi:ABC-type antimicrobial peptide transport system permease subunit